MQIIQNSTGYMRQSNKLIVKQLVLHKMNEFLSVTMFAAIVVAAIVGYFFF